MTTSPRDKLRKIAEADGPRITPFCIIDMASRKAVTICLLPIAFPAVMMAAESEGAQDARKDEEATLNASRSKGRIAPEPGFGESKARKPLWRSTCNRRRRSDRASGG